LELDEALKWELQYVSDHLEQCPDYCVLQLCRLIYSHETRSVVVSKAAAADWAHDALPDWRRHIEWARRSYAGKATAEEGELMLSELPAFHAYASSRIERAAGNETTAT
jgi:hypothetical protein